MSKDVEEKLRGPARRMVRRDGFTRDRTSCERLKSKKKKKGEGDDIRAKETFETSKGLEKKAWGTETTKARSEGGKP